MALHDPSHSPTRQWTYGEIAALPLPAAIEDHLLAALRKLTSTLDVQGVCEAVLSGVEKAFGATSSWIMLHDPDKCVLRTCLFRGRGADAYGDVEIPADVGIAGLVFSRREIQFIPDVGRESRWFNPERVRAAGLRTAFVIPLISGETAIGVLGIDAPCFGPERPPGTLEVRRLEVFAAQAAVGLLNARLYQASQQDRARLRASLRERRTLRQQVQELRGELRDTSPYGEIVGDSIEMRQILAEVEQVAASGVTVLLLGETGTGKELLARALHRRSTRAPRPFVPVNCAALPEQLVESELFGHERGAFTGAHSRKPGRFELAHRGTLFLDEIGDLPSSAQAKLLRVLQDGEVHRVGSTQALKVDVRIVAATNQDLSTRVAERVFREDLFFRLSVFPIHVPPLRERTGDIPLLTRHLVAHYARSVGKRVTGITDEALERLAAHAWPGNIRELQNVVERAIILCPNDVITAEMVRLDSVGFPRGQDSTAAAAAVQTPPRPPASSPVSPRTLADVERDGIIQALRHAEGRVSGPGGAAALLGLKPTTLHAKMKKLGVRRADAMHA